MELTQKQIDGLSGYTDKELRDYIEVAEKRLTDDGVMLNAFELLDKIEVVNEELARRSNQ